MRVLEFQAKRLLQERGIPVPRGTLLRSARDLEGLVYPAVLKAQMPVGGRGKAGGIRAASTPQEAALALEDLLSASVRGHRVRAVLGEERVETAQELYLGILIDRALRAPVLLASASGGVDVEEAARRNPHAVVRRAVDLCSGPDEHDVRWLATLLGVADRLREFRTLVVAAFAAFRELDATLVEINPLALTEAGFVALDAKLVLDDKAAFRHAELFRTLAEEAEAVAPTTRSPAECLAQAAGLTYVPLDGEIGLISDGAGTGMLTLDLIQDAGGRAADFCELGGAADAAGMKAALGAILANPRVRALLVSLIGGLTRMDEIAEGLVAYYHEHALRVPLVVRMAGTREEEGRAILRAIGVEALYDLAAAVSEAVRLAEEGEWRSS